MNFKKLASAFIGCTVAATALVSGFPAQAEHANAASNQFGGYNWAVTEGYQSASDWVNNSENSLTIAYSKLDMKDSDNGIAGVCTGDSAISEDWSSLETISFSIENPNTHDLMFSLAVGTGNTWEWHQSADVQLKAGTTTDVTFNIQKPEWKSEASGWVTDSTIANLLYVQRINLIISSLSEDTSAPSGTIIMTNWKTTSSGSSSSTQKDPVKGFYVKGNTLFDANDNPFIMKGVNYAFTWFKGTETVALKKISEYGCNTVRIVLSNGEQWGKDSASAVAKLINLCEQYKMVAVLEVHDATGYNDEASLLKAAQYFADLKDVLSGHENTVIVNIANEWQGNTNSAAWSSAYQNAIKIIRNAGLTHNIMVDAGGWGQGAETIHNKAAEVLASDTLKNVMFAIHMYEYAGGNASTIKNNIDKSLAQGVALCIGEFGWKHTGGDVDEEYILSYCKEKNVGWLAWSWYGNSEAVGYLDLVTDSAGETITDWGQTIFNSANGTKTAQTCSVFSGSQNVTTTTQKTEKTLYGDVNLDGSVTAVDVIPFIAHFLNTPLTGQALLNADVQYDGKVGLTDLATLKQYSVGDKVTLGPAA